MCLSDRTWNYYQRLEKKILDRYNVVLDDNYQENLKQFYGEVRLQMASYGGIISKSKSSVRSMRIPQVASNPRTVAAGLFYFMAVSMGLLITQKDIAHVGDITESSISKHFYLLKDHFKFVGLQVISN